MKNKITYLPIGILTITTALSGVALSSARVAADTSGSKTASVTVSAACNFTGSTSYSETVPVYAGTTQTTNAGRAPYMIQCNDPAGFKIQAIGSSPDASNPDGLDSNNFMYGSTAGNIATGTPATAGTNSYWAFKITNAMATAGTASVVTTPVDYTNWAPVPATAQDVISYTGSTTTSVIGMFAPVYQIQASATQTPGTFTGKVKYTIVPNS